MTCVNADCEAERLGWMMVLDPANEKHRGAALFIEQDSGRRYIRFLASEAEEQIAHGEGWGVNLSRIREVITRAMPSMLVYVFPPGQQCFKRHLDREVIFTHATRARLVSHSPRGFNEHMNEEAERINELRNRG